MIERTKKTLRTHRIGTDGETRVKASIPDGCSHIFFCITKVKKGRAGNGDKIEEMAFYLYQEELMAMEQFISDWKAERIRVKERNANWLAERKEKRLAKKKAKD